MCIIKKIGDWWYLNWEIVFKLIAISIVIVGFVCIIRQVKNAPPRIEQIRILAEGQLVSIRATGSFCIYDTELKFDDGSMLLMTYSFCRTNRLKIGKNYKIWESSFYGSRCKEK